MTELMLVYSIVGLVLIITSLPLALRLVGPNRWYGVRARATLSDPKVWFDANAYTARRMIATGAAMVVAAVGLYFVPGMRINTYGVACMAVAIGGVAITLIQMWLFVRRR